jgi:hypothetical protein
MYGGRPEFRDAHYWGYVQYNGRSRVVPFALDWEKQRKQFLSTIALNTTAIDLSMKREYS